MDRKKFRTNVFKVLFQAEFHEREQMPQVCDWYMESEGISQRTQQEALRSRVMDILERMTQIDEQIEAHSKGWSLARMGAPERTILRIAVYEMKFDEEVPDAVAINEAVELAKVYAQDKAPAFINGILGAIAGTGME